MKIAGVQLDLKLGDVAHNIQRIRERATEAAAEGASLVVFPECATTGYCFESLDEAAACAEPIPGETTRQLQAIARDLGIHLICGMLELHGDAVFNVVVCVDSDGILGHYRKTHLPQLGVDHFTTPGEQPYVTFSAGDLRIGMLICYDASFPEASRVLTLDGADIIVLPTNWPFGAEPTADYVINARASENKVYFIAVDRVGRERGFQFIGKSKICDVHGRTLAMADHQDEAIIYAEIDPAEARTKFIERVKGRHSIDRLADRRPELYRRIIEPK